jgi:hypothetical protein
VQQPMSALGHKRTYAVQKGMSALPPIATAKADIAQLIVRVAAKAIFPNCPRYIPDMRRTEPSVYAPRKGQEAPEPAWKCIDAFKDCVHPRQPTFKG